MEPLSYWTRFLSFIRSSFTDKFKAFFPGALVGLFSAKSLLFGGLPTEVVTFGTYILKYIGTVAMSFGSGLATAYGAFLIDRYKEKKSPIPPIENKKRKRA